MGQADSPNYFQGRKLVIATMHGKEKVIAPLAVEYLAVQQVIIPSIDTDQFGTFTGEVERTLDPVATLRLKIETALRISGETLGIGNEGSFGPHPSIPFIPADQELTMLVDTQNDLAITGHYTTTDTNFARKDIVSLSDLKAFAEKTGFPGHALILSGINNGVATRIVKGLQDSKNLEQAYATITSIADKVVAETDMRAHYNPTRMEAIAIATKRLMERARSVCPRCQTPGYGPVSVVEGLFCQCCGSPTRVARGELWSCQKCQYEEERLFADKFADPMYCDHCNS